MLSKFKLSILLLLISQSAFAVDYSRYSANRNRSSGFNLFQNGDCKALKAWISNAPATVGRSGYRNENLLPLVSDNVFVPAFGKSYDHLTNEDYSRYSREIRPICIKERTFEYQELGLIDRVWRAPNQALVDVLVKNRNDRKNFVDINNSLSSLRPIESDYAKLVQIDANIENILQQSSPEEKNEFNLLLEDAKKRVSYPVVQAKLDALLPSSNGKSGVHTLTAFINELNRKALPQESINEVKSRVSKRLAEISPEVVQSELAVFNAIPQTVPGLINGAKWLRQFDSQYVNTIAITTSFANLRKEVLMTRSMLTNNLKPQIESMIASSESQTDLGNIPNSFFISEELNSEPAISIVFSANKRIAFLQKVERDKEVFGRSSEEASQNHYSVPSSQNSQSSANAAGGVTSAEGQSVEVTQCDVLATDPQDNTRVTDGVEYKNLIADKAVKECNFAVKKSPKNARYHLQLARAYLVAKNNAKALNSLKTSADLGSALANKYMSDIYAEGMFGVKVNKAKSEEYRNKAEKLIESQEEQVYASSQSQNYSENASKGGNVYATPQNTELSGNYNYPNLVRAMMLGDSSQLTEDRLTNYQYYLGQASALSNECHVFTLKEINEYGFSTDGTETVDHYKYTYERLKSMGRTMKEMGQNPVGAVYDGYKRRREQEKVLMNRQQASSYGYADFWPFFSEQGNQCSSPVIQSYTKNLKAYLNNKPQ